MSLPACQQRILDRIDGTLQARDPRLASLFSIFTRLTRHEPMPGREELDGSGRFRRTLRGLRKMCRLRGMRRLRPWARLRPIMLVPVALAAIIGLLVLGPLAASPRLCGAVPALHVTAHQSGQAVDCRTGRPRTVRFPRR
jgi:hypothetical protein